MKVFQIGFNRCGTTSIYNFFKTNTNLKCLHYEGGRIAFQMLQNQIEQRPLLEGKYQSHNVFTDMQAFVSAKGKTYLLLAHTEYYKTLDHQYPNSKFILNTRDIEKWIESRIKHYTKNGWIRRMPQIYDTDDFVQIWRRQWIEHHEDTKEYFKDRDNFLVFDIEKDSGEKIAHFIPEVRFKNTKFPKLN